MDYIKPFAMDLQPQTGAFEGRVSRQNIALRKCHSQRSMYSLLSVDKDIHVKILPRISATRKHFKCFLNRVFKFSWLTSVTSSLVVDRGKPFLVALLRVFAISI